MASIIDFSVDRPKRSKQVRYSLGYGTVRDGAEIITSTKTITQQTQNGRELASVKLHKALESYEEFPKELIDGLVNNIYRLPQLPHLNPTILAGALYILQRIGDNEFNREQFDLYFNDVERTLDIPATSNEELIVLTQRYKEALLRYIFAINNFRTT